jgi:hypothetical protein
MASRYSYRDLRVDGTGDDLHERHSVFAEHHVVKILRDLFHTGLRIRPVRRTQRFPPLP